MKYLFLLAALVLSLLLLPTCNSPSSFQEAQNTMVINVNTLADNFGNNDGVTTEAEIDTLNNYFGPNEYAWFVGGFPSPDKVTNDTTANLVTYSFKIQIYPYPSEQDLRRAYKGRVFRTPWLGITVLEKRNDYIIVVNCFNAPGPNISNGEWEQLELPFVIHILAP